MQPSYLPLCARFVEPQWIFVVLCLNMSWWPQRHRILALHGVGVRWAASPSTLVRWFLDQTLARDSHYCVDLVLVSPARADGKTLPPPLVTYAFWWRSSSLTPVTFIVLTLGFPRRRHIPKSFAAYPLRTWGVWLSYLFVGSYRLSCGDVPSYCYSYSSIIYKGTVPLNELFMNIYIGLCLYIYYYNHSLHGTVLCHGRAPYESNQYGCCSWTWPLCMSSNIYGNSDCNDLHISCYHLLLRPWRLTFLWESHSGSKSSFSTC